MNCDQARTELIAYLKGELTPDALDRLEDHLARCPSCRQELEGARKLLSWTEAASEQGVVKAVEQTIDDAILANASDIHWEPQRDNSLLVRYRVDGVLHETARLDPTMRLGVVNRIKMMAGMEMAETRIPQDGRIVWKREGNAQEYDMRVHCGPFIFGEGFVMRILDRSSVLIGLDKLGFYEDRLNLLTEIAGEPLGMIVFTGPTGSGKTTTIYSLLKHLISPEKKILTVEDPVEYQMTGLNQVQVRPKLGLTFATAVRSFLRSDPDIIFVGATRDLETAVLSTEAAVTGHLVLTTLHTVDAVSALSRLVDMGVEPFMVSATVIGVVSQRLARMVCANCKEEIHPDPESPMMRFLNISSNDLATHQIYHGKGCDVCRKTGYKGRIGVFEVLRVDRELTSMLIDRAPLKEITDAAVAKGFVTLRDDARRKVLDGLTTPEEAARVLVSLGE